MPLDNLSMRYGALGPGAFQSVPSWLRPLGGLSTNRTLLGALARASNRSGVTRTEPRLPTATIRGSFMRLGVASKERTRKQI
jgi:hypothetical protein